MRDAERRARLNAIQDQAIALWEELARLAEDVAEECHADRHGPQGADLSKEISGLRLAQGAGAREGPFPGTRNAGTATAHGADGSYDERDAIYGQEARRPLPPVSTRGGPLR